MRAVCIKAEEFKERQSRHLLHFSMGIVMVTVFELEEVLAKVNAVQRYLLHRLDPLLD